MGQGQTRPDPEIGDLRPRTAAWLNAETTREKRNAKIGNKGKTRQSIQQEETEREMEVAETKKASDRVVGWDGRMADVECGNGGAEATGGRHEEGAARKCHPAELALALAVAAGESPFCSGSVCMLGRGLRETRYKRRGYDANHVH